MRTSKPLIGRLIAFAWLATLLVVSASACWGRNRLSPSPVVELLVEYRRMGGFAAYEDSLVIQTDGGGDLKRRVGNYRFSLDRSALDRLIAQFTAARFETLASEYLPADRCCDRVDFSVRFRAHTVRTMDGAIPPVLEPVIQALNELIAQYSGAP